MIKKLIALLSIVLLLPACGVPPTIEQAQPSSTTNSPVTETPIALTDTLSGSAALPTVTLSITSLQMIDANVGWAEGIVTLEHDPSRFSDTLYSLLRTTDGGETWQDVTPPIQFGSPSLLSIRLFAVDTDTAWAVPSGYPFSEQPPYLVVWRTTDGGKSWKPSNPVDISDSPLRDVIPLLQFVDREHGWLTLRFEHRVEAYYLDYRTSDGGRTWEQIGKCYTFDGDIIGRCTVPTFIDAQTGWRTSLHELTSTGELNPAAIWHIQRTLDAGQTWQIISLPSSKEEKNCSHSPTRVATGIVGIRVDCITPTDIEESFYYLSVDGGQTWQVLPQAPDADLFFLDMSTGWRISESNNGYQLERTTDGGGTWQKVADGLPGGGIQFVDAETGWAGIYDNSDLQRTTDGGVTWQRISPQLMSAGSGNPVPARLESGHPLVLKSIQMVDSLNGWSVGANGYIFHTTDGGTSWQDVTPLYGQIVADREFFALDAMQAWTTVPYPKYETIWATSDGGQSWQQIVALSEGQSVAAGSIRFLKESTGWFQSTQAGGESNQFVQVMKTQDNGLLWEVQSQSSRKFSYAGRDRLGFMFLDEQNGFRIEPVGQYTHTLQEFLNATPVLLSKTTDGGNIWSPVDLPDMVLNSDEIILDQEAYPGAFKELMQDTLSCEEGTTLHAFSADTIGFRLVCRGAYREVYGTYGYVFVLSEYYLSTDAGKTWSNWMSFGEVLPREQDVTPTESEIFLPDGFGWRLKANQLLSTTDGGKTWTSLKDVGWEQARLYFVNSEEGWAIARTGHATSLVHTTDGGKTWEEIKPFVSSE